MANQPPKRLSLSLSSPSPVASAPIVDEPLIALDMLEPGICATVRRIDSTDDNTDRLMSMGVCLGRRIDVIQRGDPMILRVLSSRVGLSRRLAKKIMVGLCTAPECQPPS